MPFRSKYSYMWFFELAVGIIVSASIVHYLHRSILDSEANLENTRKVVKCLDNIMIMMLNAETGQRGYIITNRKEYLKPYKIAESSIDINIIDLRNLINDREKINHLDYLVNKKFLEMDRTLKVRENNGFTPTRDEMLTDYGKSLMDEIRQTLDSLYEVENRSLQIRRDDIRSKLNNMSIIFPSLICGNFVLMAIVYYFVKEHDRAEYERSKKITLKKLREDGA